jgi:hypothetical protein
MVTAATVAMALALAVAAIVLQLGQRIDWKIDLRFATWMETGKEN